MLAQGLDGAPQRQFLDLVRPEHVHGVLMALRPRFEFKATGGDERKRPRAPVEVDPQHPAREPHAVQGNRVLVDCFDGRELVDAFWPRHRRCLPRQGQRLTGEGRVPLEVQGRQHATLICFEGDGVQYDHFAG